MRAIVLPACGLASGARKYSGRGCWQLSRSALNTNSAEGHAISETMSTFRPSPAAQSETVCAALPARTACSLRAAWRAASSTVMIIGGDSGAGESNEKSWRYTWPRRASTQTISKPSAPGPSRRSRAIAAMTARLVDARTDRPVTKASPPGRCDPDSGAGERTGPQRYGDAAKPVETKIGVPHDLPDHRHQALGMTAHHRFTTGVDVLRASGRANPNGCGAGCERRIDRQNAAVRCHHSIRPVGSSAHASYVASQNLSDFVKCKARQAWIEAGRIAVTDIDQEIGT